jgi:hypothetical protein
MTTRTEHAIIEFPPDWDDRAEYEMTPKGYLSCATIRLTNGLRYPVYFSDPVRLRQDLEALTEMGKPFFAEPNLIVVPEVTREALQAAVDALAREGYFDHLKPLS